MSDTPGKPGPKPHGFIPWAAQLWPDQVQAIRETAAREIGERQGNALLRDIIDFWGAHRPLFFTWRASRGNTPREPLA